MRREPTELVIGGAVLVIGLLLILAGLASARIPGERRSLRPGIARSPGTAGRRGTARLARRARNPIRAFLLSPIHPATWYANAAIALGLFVGVFAFAAWSSASHRVGPDDAPRRHRRAVHRLRDRGLAARRPDRAPARVRSASRTGLLAHPYRPLRGGFVDILRAEFADESRWRDVLYVAVNFPLAIIEFVVVVIVWVARALAS